MPDDAEHEEGEVIRNGACLSDRAVSHETAEAALLECAEVSDKERDACEERNERSHLVLDWREWAIDEYDEECYSGCFRGHGKHGGYRRWCTFVNVRSPGVEREQRKLEAYSAEEEQHGNPQEWARTACDSGLDFVEVEAPGESVEVAEAEQFKCRRDRAHQDVLGGGFGTVLVAFVPGGECVHRDGRNFKAEEKREQVASAHDREAAERRKSNGADEFGNLVHGRFLVGAVFEVIFGKPHAKQSAHHEHFAHEHAEVVHFPVADKELAVAACERDEVQQEEDGDKADVCHAPRDLGLCSHEKAYPNHDERENQQQDVR